MKSQRSFLLYLILGILLFIIRIPICTWGNQLISDPGSRVNKSSFGLRGHFIMYTENPIKYKFPIVLFCPYQKPHQVSKVISLWLIRIMWVREVGKMDLYLWQKGWLLWQDISAFCWKLVICDVMWCNWRVLKGKVKDWEFFYYTSVHFFAGIGNAFSIPYAM